MTKTRIAILISLLLAMPAAVVALEQAAPSFTTTATEPQTTDTAGASSSVTQAGDPAQAVEPAAGFARATRSDTFPQSDGDYQRMPAEIAYYNRIERERAHLVARGDVFAQSADDYKPLPAALAYYERLERERGHLVARGDSYPAGALGAVAASPAASARTVQASATSQTEPSRNPLRSAADYVAGLFKSDRSTSTAMENTASADSQQANATQ